MQSLSKPVNQPHPVPQSRGFSLIELMVVIAVMAILALIALPSYLDRLVREQIAEALPLADIFKPAVEKAWRLGKPLPATNADAELPEPDKVVNAVVTSVTLKEGAINIAFGGRAQKALRGRILTLRPAVVESAPIVPVAWLCGMAPTPDKMTVIGDNQTTVTRALLPIRCR